MKNSSYQEAKIFQKLWHGADYNYEQWLDEPQVLTEDLRLMQLARCNIMSVGIFSWAMLEPQEESYDFSWLDKLMDDLANQGISAALATPSAAPPVWLSQKYPETRRVNAEGIRQPHKYRQNFCYTSPIYREKIVALNRQLAQRYGQHPALVLWHVSNEYGSTHCHCDLCYAAFRTWLQDRYQNLDKLNHEWWSTFWSHRYTAWDQIEPVNNAVHGLMLDWQRFTSDQALDFFKAESAPLRELTPHMPLTTNFMKPDVGLNYWRFAEHVDIVSWDSYPQWHQTDEATTAMQTAFYHDMHRSYRQGQPFLLMESTPSVTNWQEVSRLKKPGMHTLSSLQAVAHGANSVQYFQWRQSRGGQEKFHGAVVNHLGSENTRTFRDVMMVGSILEKLSPITHTSIQAPVAIIYDFENEWVLNYAQLPRNVGETYQETCQSHYQSLWQHGTSIDIIHAEADLSAYRIVIAPMLYMLRPGVAERIEAFVLAGGIFVTTYLSGYVNESDLCFIGGYPPALRRTLGIYSEELDTLTDVQTGSLAACADNGLQLQGQYQTHHFAELVQMETAQILAEYSADFYKGYPALTVNSHGNGQAFYIAARTDARFLSDFYTAILKRAGVENDLPLVVPQDVSIQVRANDSQRFIFLMNFSDQEREVGLKTVLTDVVNEKAVKQSIVLPPYGFSVLRQEQYPKT
jgi:beta-galactosidase